MIPRVKAIVNVIWWIFFKPEIIVPTFGSYGDLLMTNGVLKEYSERQNKRLYIICRNVELLYNLPFIEKYICHSTAYYLAIKLQKWIPKIKIINYGAITENADQHLMQRIAKRLSFQLQPDFKPYYIIDYSKDEFGFNFELNKPVICIQSEAKIKFTHNKNWISGRIDEVVENLNSKAITIQIGLKNDRILNTHYHYNGKLSFRQSIYLLSKSSLFVGTEGALMHASSAINTKAVIIFGGYIHPHQSGYSNIVGLKSDVECAPCLLTTKCPYELKCMKTITAKDVIKKIEDTFNDI